MLAFIGLTAVLFLGLAYVFAQSMRTEVSANWSKYRDDPFFMFMAPLFKPEDDSRTPVQFGADNFSEVLMTKLNQIFAVLLAPLFTILKSMSDMLVESTNGLFNMKSFLSKLYSKISSVNDIFQRRFANTLFALQKTNIGLYNSFQRTYAAATASAFAGYSAFQAINGAFKLMITTAIVILVILVALVILFFFVLAPSIPLILSVITIIGATSAAASVGGMSSAFCFAPNTQVLLASGPKSIYAVKVGDTTASGAQVTATFDFAVQNADIYELFGVQVSGNHIVYFEETPIHVRDHPYANRLPGYTGKLYCLSTTDHVIETAPGLTFADWEELDSEADLLDWYKEVYTRLNNTDVGQPKPLALDQEAAFSGKTRIPTSLGPVEIRNLTPGMKVYDEHNRLTKIIGLVRLAPTQIKSVVRIDSDAYGSAAIWRRSGSTWKQPSISELQTVPECESWYHLFTESGTFRLCGAEGEAVRDFSDVGAEQLEQTYGWVLDALAAPAPAQKAALPHNLESFNRRTACPPELFSF
jgi:hypothetical protein